MSAPISNCQKRILSQMGARAFRFLGAKARGRGEPWPAENTAALEAFRHEQVALAVGKLGLRCCSQLDYKAVEAHFLQLLGQDGAAFNAHLRAQTEPRRQAEAVLWREVQAAADMGITPAYVGAICKAQFKCSPLEAGEKQLWSLVYTVRNRAAARRRETRKEQVA